MKRQLSLVLLLACVISNAAYADTAPDLRGPVPVTAQSETMDIDVKTGGYHSAPTVAAEKYEKEEAKKKPGFWGKWHPDNIKSYHPKVCKTFGVWNFFYEHGGKQTLDITAKACQIATPFVFN